MGRISSLFMLAVFLVIGLNFYKARQKQQKARLHKPGTQKLAPKVEKPYPTLEQLKVNRIKYMNFLRNQLPSFAVPSPKRSGLKEELLLKFDQSVKEMIRRKFPLEAIRDFENLEFAKAIKLFSRDLQAETATPDRPVSAYYLGHIYSLMLKVGESVQYYLRAVTEKKNDPDYKRELANAFFLESNYRDADLFFRQALETYQKNPRKNFDSVVYTLNNLGEIRYKEKEYLHALDYFQESLKTIRQKEATDGIMALTVLKKVGKTYKGLDNLSKAAETYQAALEISREKMSDRPGEIAFLLNKLGVTELSSGHPRAALKRFSEAVEMGRKSLKPEDPTLALRLVNLGGALKALGRNRAALKNFQEAYHIFSRRLGEDHISTKETREWIRETKQVITAVSQGSSS
ncbi:MAG: tetratricopeptide repeat protein [bacterium]